METATLDRPMQQTPASSGPAKAAPTSTTTSVSKTSVLVGLCFLTATFTFAIGNALIRSYFSSATAHIALIAGVSLLGCCGLAVAANADQPLLRAVHQAHPDDRSSMPSS